MGFDNREEMRKEMHRFFTDPSAIDKESVMLFGQDAHHIKNVLRMKRGEHIYISCGDEWEYTCEITGLEDGCVTARIVDMQKAARELPSKITLYQCLPKREKMETIIQKAVELGVYNIVPVVSSRCVVKYDAKKIADRLTRWNSIAREAAKQAKRLIEPKVEPLLTFDEAVHSILQKDQAFIPYEKAEGIMTTRRLFEGITAGQSVGILIGPEGGFDDFEVQKAVSSGIRAVTLGGRILRTETAGPAVLAILAYLLEQDVTQPGKTARPQNALARSHFPSAPCGSSGALGERAR